jgi:hypothetical protein
MVPLGRMRVALVLLATAVACGGETDPSSPSPSSTGARGSIAELQASADVELSLLNAQSQLTTGENVFTFGLSSGPGELIGQGTPQVFVATSPEEPALGPFEATWHEFTAYELTGDRGPEPGLPGFFAATVEFPEPGNWLVAAAANVEDGSGVGVGAIAVVEASEAFAAVGSKALAVKTPVATEPSAVRQFCTRQPPDPLHYISLDDALSNGKPTVVTFGTPLLCESRMCGPVVDEVMLVFEEVGKEKANFVHVEVFPTRQVDEPARPFLQWGFESEPWTVVIDGDGTIRARLEGPASATLVEQALRPLL